MDKLTVINNALLNTGNSRVNVLHDPSDEYIVAEVAFDRWVRFLRVRHSWPFSETIEALVRVPDADNTSRTYPDNGFRIPSTAFHVKEIYWGNTLLTDYEIIGDVLSCNLDSDIYAKVIREQADAKWHPLAEEILTLYVESGCLRGLNEDFKEAERREAKAEGMIGEVRTAVDQQNPARNIYKSSIRDARLRRRV